MRVRMDLVRAVRPQAAWSELGSLHDGFEGLGGSGVDHVACVDAQSERPS